MKKFKPKFALIYSIKISYDVWEMFAVNFEV